jgi:hypothetical protein
MNREMLKILCAKAAVFEATIRCGKLGAKTAYVLSSQQFYPMTTRSNTPIFYKWE